MRPRNQLEALFQGVATWTLTPRVVCCTFLVKWKTPRMDRTKLHALGDILAIMICAVICGADEWTEIELFGKAKLEWLRTFLELPNGIPSHDTFGRVFSRLDPVQLERCFGKWIANLAEASGGKLIAVDGNPTHLDHRMT